MTGVEVGIEIGGTARVTDVDWVSGLVGGEGTVTCEITGEAD